jgi:hypothetical protein
MTIPLIDVVNDLEFKGGENLLPYALAMASALAVFKRRAKRWEFGNLCQRHFGTWRARECDLVT